MAARPAIILGALAALALVVVLVVVLAGGDGGGRCEEPVAATGPGERALFDGTEESLSRWALAGAGRFELTADCTLRTVGGLGLLWYDDEALASPVTVEVEWRARGDSNSGVFVGFPAVDGDPLVAVARGYEVQIDPADEAGWTTGAIYGVRPADEAARDGALAPPGEWNTFAVAIDAPRVVVRLNGIVVNELVSDDPAREGLARGFVGLQNHGEADEVFFRSVRVRAGAAGT